LAKVKFIVDGVEILIDSTIDVKLGDVLGPKLFIFCVAKVITTWRSSYSYNLCIIRCKPDFQLTRRRPTTKADLDIDHEYADDITFTFETREDCARITPLILKHVSRWGFEVHVGSKDNNSKSEDLVCAKYPRCYANSTDYDGIDLSPI